MSVVSPASSLVLPSQRLDAQPVALGPNESTMAHGIHLGDHPSILIDVDAPWRASVWTSDGKCGCPMSVCFVRTQKEGLLISGIKLSFVLVDVR